MKAINDNTGTPIAKGLNVLLIIAMGLMVMAIILFVAFGIILSSDNFIKSEFLLELAESGTRGTPKNAAIACFGGAFIASVWLFVLAILRKVVRTLLHGDPFIPENISRLRTIWIIIATSEIIRIIIVKLSSAGEMETDIRIGTIFLVFVIAALSEVFRHGTELRRDAELTI